MLIDSDAAITAARIATAFFRVAEALTAWVVPCEGRFLVDDFSQLASVEKSERAYWC